MRLFLLRHGDALHPYVDPQRPLSPLGRDEVELIARALAGTQVDEIQHSGILRAEQTATIVAEHVTSAAGIRQVGGICPEDDPRHQAAVLQAEERDLFLASHLPFVDLLTSLLLTGGLDRCPVSFTTACLAEFERKADAWRLVRFLTPDDVRRAHGDA